MGFRRQGVTGAGCASVWMAKTVPGVCRGGIDAARGHKKKQNPGKQVRQKGKHKKQKKQNQKKQKLNLIKKKKKKSKIIDFIN